MYVGCEADFMMEFFQNKIASLQKFIVPIGRDGFLEGVVVEG